jgi:hypothetical protein
VSSKKFANSGCKESQQEQIEDKRQFSGKKFSKTGTSMSDMNVQRSVLWIQIRNDLIGWVLIRIGNTN